MAVVQAVKWLWAVSCAMDKCFSSSSLETREIMGRHSFPGVLQVNLGNFCKEVEIKNVTHPILYAI
jgi:hypothetical protein